MSRMDPCVPPDTDALQLDTRFVAIYEFVLSAESVVSFVSVLTRRRFFRNVDRGAADLISGLTCSDWLEPLR